MRAGLVIVATLIAFLAGCASSQGPDELRIAGDEYAAAYDAAITAARQEGFVALVLDRRAGVIETDVRTASTVLEPWDDQNSSASQAWESTLQFQRRRIRFDFAPADAPEPTFPPDGALTGAEPITEAGSGIDLTAHDGEIVVRAVVVVERHYAPGERRSMWSRKYVTQTRFGGDEQESPTSIWRPVARDVAFERRLLAAVEARLSSMTAAQPSPGP